MKDLRSFRLAAVLQFAFACAGATAQAANTRAIDSYLSCAHGLLAGGLVAESAQVGDLAETGLKARAKRYYAIWGMDKARRPGIYVYVMHPRPTAYFYKAKDFPSGLEGPRVVCARSTFARAKTKICFEVSPDQPGVGAVIGERELRAIPPGNVVELTDAKDDWGDHSEKLLAEKLTSLARQSPAAHQSSPVGQKHAATTEDFVKWLRKCESAGDPALRKASIAAREQINPPSVLPGEPKKSRPKKSGSGL